jgi:tetratricopeptide (TPR) repeat protein
VDIPPTPEVERLDPQMRRKRLETVTSDLLGRLLNSPIVMVLNDVHFMDDATLALVRRLAADTPHRPWLLIVTRRPGTAAPVDPGPDVTTLELEPLDPAAANEFLLAATENLPLTGHRRRELVARAGGNPLFLTRLVTAAAAGADLDSLPDSLEGMISAQIDRLPAPKRRWLRAASVLGMVVEPSWLAAMLAGTDLLADTSAADLSEFITEHLDSRLHFVHHLVRLTAYEGLPYRRRTELHARAAEIIEAALGTRSDSHAALLSLHCLNGGRFAEAWRYARLAGDQARAQYALTEAASCYQRAVAAAKHVPALADVEVSDVYAALAEVSMDLGEMPAAEHALRRARVHAKDDPRRLARLQLKTAQHRQHVGRHTDALRWIARGRTSAGQGDGALSLRAELAERGALIRYDQGAYKQAMAWATRAVDEARAAGDPVLEARGLGVLVGQAALAGLPIDPSRVSEALDMYERTGDLRGKARTSNALGVWAYFAGRWDDAVAYYAQAEHASHQIGRDFDAAAAAANQAEVLIQQGRMDDADRVLTPAIRTLVEANATSFLAFAVALSGRILVAHGRYGDALDRFTQARSMCLEMGEVGEALAIEAHSAECVLRAGEPEEAVRLSDRTAGSAESRGVTASVAAHLHRVRGEALIALRQHEAGATHVRAALAEARARDTSYEIEASLRALLRLGVAASAAEAAQWNAERTELARALGITYSP